MISVNSREDNGHAAVEGAGEQRFRAARDFSKDYRLTAGGPEQIQLAGVAGDGDDRGLALLDIDVEGLEVA